MVIVENMVKNPRTCEMAEPLENCEELLQREIVINDKFIIDMTVYSIFENYVYFTPLVRKSNP
jgi:hypothetical protein